jgi:peptidyl-prolyl cis-trans isomerase C
MPFPYRPLVLITAGLLLAACNEQSPTEQAAAPAPAQEATPAATEATAAASAPAADLNDPNVLVIVNGKVITRDTYSVFNQQRRQAMPGGDSPQEQLAAVNELINATLLRQDAEAQGLDNQPELEMMMELITTRMLAEAALREHLGKNEPSEEELKQLYDSRYGGQKNLEFKASHILLKTEEDAKAVIAELDKGTDFAELAKTRSTGPSGPQGGDLGWFEPNQMVEPFANAVVELEDGAYTKAPVQTEFGWHVILREEHRELETPSFEQVRMQLLQAKQQELIGDYITQLREKGDIQIQPPQTPPDHPPMEQPAE